MMAIQDYYNDTLETNGMAKKMTTEACHHPMKRGEKMHILHYADIIRHSNSGSVFGKDSTTFPRILGICRPSQPDKTHPNKV